MRSARCNGRRNSMPPARRAARWDRCTVFLSVSRTSSMSPACPPPWVRRSMQARWPALPRPPRLAAVRSPVWSVADEGQKEMFAGNVAALRRAGAVVDEVELPGIFTEAHDAHRSIMAYEGAMNFAPVQRQHRDRLSARLNQLIDEGAAMVEGRYRVTTTGRRQGGKSSPDQCVCHAKAMVPTSPLRSIRHRRL